MRKRKGYLGVVLLCILVICIIVSILFPPECNGQFRMANDSFIAYDKLAHVGGSSLLYLGILRITENNKTAVLTTLGLGILWEIKDGHVKWEDHGFWGGDGFSWRDIVANTVGIMLAQIILDVFDAPIYIRAINNGVSLSYRF